MRADWRQFRGPAFDGSAQGVILREWPSTGPRQIWKRPIKSGFSSFVLAKQTLCTLVLRQSNGAQMEGCLALDAGTGRELWFTFLTPAKYTGVEYGNRDGSANYGAPDNLGGDGPRSTPAMDGERVYVTSSALVVFCLDASNGKILWKRDLMREHHGVHIYYENAASPLLVGDLVLVAGGGSGESILGLNKFSGAVEWKVLNELLTHSTPTLTRLHGIDQAIFYTRSGLVSLTPEDGNVLWRYKFPYRVCAAISPVVARNYVYCSAGYGTGAGVCKVNRDGIEFSTEEIWRLRHNEPVANYWSTPVHKEGYLYGMFGFKKFNTAPLKCVNVRTGDVKWTQPGFGHGSVILVNDLLLAMAGFGELTLINPAPDEYRELARAKVLSGKCWATPIFSGGRLYARSTTEAICLDLSAEGLDDRRLDSAAVESAK